MPQVTRRQFGVLALAGGLGTLARAARGFPGDPPPTRADPAVAEGTTIRICLRDGRTVARVCRRGYWITARPGA